MSNIETKYTIHYLIKTEGGPDAFLNCSVSVFSEADVQPEIDYIVIKKKGSIHKITKTVTIEPQITDITSQFYLGKEE